MNNNFENKMASSTNISSSALRYLKMIDAKKDEKIDLDLLNMSIYNQTCNKIQLENIHKENLVDRHKIFFNSTDILIDNDSNIFNKPQTEQMSFIAFSRNLFESSFPDESSISGNNFSSSLNEIQEKSSFFNEPPKKRICYEPQESFFKHIRSEQSLSATTDSFFKQSAIVPVTTNDIFDIKPLKNQTLNFLNTFSDFRQPKQSNRIEFTLSSSTGLSDCISDLEMPTFNDVINKANELEFSKCSKNDSNPKISSIFDETQNDVENASRKSKTITINTFYQVPYIVDTKKIDEWYETHKFEDWDSIKDNIDDIMEPSIEYVAHRLKCLRPITLGKKEEIIECEDSDVYSCDSINETVEQIEESFEKGIFVCSTQENSINVDTGTNPLNIAFLDYISDPCNTSNTVKENENDDANTTKSFLVNKDVASDNVWSALTHVSCSVPMTSSQQQNDEPIFDITTIFDYTNHDDLINDKADNKENSLDDDTTRYELLLSLLNDANYENILETTSKDLHETIKIAHCRKAAIMSQIEIIIETLVKSVVKQDAMILKFHKIKKWDECEFDGNVLSQKETAITIKSLSFTNKNTKRTFTIVVNLLGEIYKLLIQNMTCTKREFYYRDVELMRNQTSVNKAIDEICELLNVQCWELGIISTSKGLVAGDLRIITDEDVTIDYSTVNAVPQKPSLIKSMESNAEYVLVVEKDTVFTRLIEEKILDKIGTKIILVTAKGYPDINTRLLLRKIETELQIPIYIIVDADAFGIDIMCTYKFGSLQMVKFSEQLAIRTMEWIGIHPTDIEKLDITRTELTDTDLKKVDELLQRPYMNDQLRSELEHLKSRRLKAEIENIYHYSIDYLIYDYIPEKIALMSGPMEQIIKEVSNSQNFR